MCICVCMCVCAYVCVVCMCSCTLILDKDNPMIIQFGSEYDVSMYSSKKEPIQK